MTIAVEKILGTDLINQITPILDEAIRLITIERDTKCTPAQIAAGREAAREAQIRANSYGAGLSPLTTIRSNIQSISAITDKNVVAYKVGQAVGQLLAATDNTKIFGNFLTLADLQPGGVVSSAHVSRQPAKNPAYPNNDGLKFLTLAGAPIYAAARAQVGAIIDTLFTSLENEAGVLASVTAEIDSLTALIGASNQEDLLAAERSFICLTAISEFARPLLSVENRVVYYFYLAMTQFMNQSKSKKFQAYQTLQTMAQIDPTAIATVVAYVIRHAQADLKAGREAAAINQLGLMDKMLAINTTYVTSHQAGVRALIGFLG